MDGRLIVTLVVWGAVVLVAIIVAMTVLRRPRGAHVRRGPGPGATGAVYGMLNEDKQRARTLTNDVDQRPL